jgi:ABC-type uncharacterized transport system involved in gliding motility auxiliary subunit
MQRILDWGGYFGLAVLLAAFVLPFVKPEWGRMQWWLVGAGVLLVLASLLGHVNVRGAVGRRSTRYGFNAAVAVVLILAIASFVEAVSYRRNARLDLTENRRHSLAPQTIQLLKGLSTDVNAVAFFRSDQPGKRVAEDLLKQYARYSSGKLTWKAVDPDREPGLARRYAVESYGTIVLETKTKSEKVLDAEEEKLTNGLLKVTREGKRAVYVVQGHGEHELTSSERAGFTEAKAALERANYEVKPLVLARQDKIPDDAAVVIVAGPRAELLQPEIDALDRYVGKGGKLLAMVDPVVAPNQREAANLKNFLGKLGFELGDSLIIELNPIGRLFGIGPEVPIVQQYEPHPITRDLGGVTTLFPLSRPVNSAKTPPPGTPDAAPGGWQVQPLARTSADSWGETDKASLQQGQVKPDPQDPKGPLPVAAVATKDKSRIVVYGSSSLAANQFLNLQGNRDFFLNTVSWLAEEEDQISVRPKDVRQTPVFLSGQQEQAVRTITLFLVPGIVVVGGIVAAVRRRAAM